MIARAYINSNQLYMTKRNFLFLHTTALEIEKFLFNFSQSLALNKVSIYEIFVNLTLNSIRRHRYQILKRKIAI